MTATDLRWGWARVDARGPRAAGVRAAAAALAQCGSGLRVEHVGARPIVAGEPGLAISVSHGRRVAVAVIGAVAQLGVDLCEVDRGPRVRAFAVRFLSAGERSLLRDDRAGALIWAAKEAGLKALGLGLLDGGMFDDPTKCPVRVESLAPPRYASPSQLALELHDDATEGVVVALAYAGQTAPSTSTVAPFM